MKMNNLSNPSRVILSVAKDLAIAASLFAFAACSDYLEDFQDKYDDGKAFAEISSDNGSSDGELSSSSDDSKLSSSSKGNGDVDSSDSTDSSSSATDPGSSSSVTESSSAFEPCKGTIIYDASKDSLNGIFGYPFMANSASGMQASSKGIKAKLRDKTEFLTLPLADLSNDKTRDIETWGGLCIEYSSDGQADFVLLNDSLEKVRRFLSNELPVTNGDKASFKWLWSENEKLQEKQAELGYSDEPLSINKVSRLHFDNYNLPKTTTITIFRITTINEVDLDVGSSSSVAESSSSAFESCTGTVIYDASDSEPTKTRFGTYFKYYGNPQRGVVDIDKDTKSAPVSINDHPGFLFSESYTIKDISSWEGLCIEYTSSTPLGIFLLSHNGNDVNSAAYRELPTNSGEPVLVSWNDMFQVFDDLSGYRAFSFDHVDQIYFGYEKNAVLANISRITTIAKDVDLNAGASSEDPSTGYILPTNECPGTEIYNEDKGNIFEFPVKSWNEGNTTTTLTNMSLIGETGVDGVYFFMADPSLGKTISIEQWGGLCLEYTSTNEMYVEIANVQNSQTRALASSTLSAQKTKIAYAIPLKAFYDVYVSDDPYFVNGTFKPTEVNRISFTNINVGTTQASISRITTLYPGVTFE